MTSHSNFCRHDNDRATVAVTVATVGDSVGNGAIATVTVTNPDDEIIVTDDDHLKSSFPRKRESRTNNPAQPTEFNAAVTVPTVLYNRTDDRRHPAMTDRTAKVSRSTRETEIAVAVNLDGGGVAKLKTGVPFLEHMLDQVARHGVLDLDITAQGDLEVDAHHTVEDIGITFGQAVARALGDKAGVRRYGHAYIPLDESLSRVVIDFSGRPLLTMNARFPDATVGAFATGLVHEFFQGFCNHAQVTLHIDNLRGENSHHIAETIFKAFGRALRMAAERDPRTTGVPSTKGML